MCCVPASFSLACSALPLPPPPSPAQRAVPRRGVGAVRVRHRQAAARISGSSGTGEEAGLRTGPPHGGGSGGGGGQAGERFASGCRQPTHPCTPASPHASLCLFPRPSSPVCSSLRGRPSSCRRTATTIRTERRRRIEAAMLAAAARRLLPYRLLQLCGSCSAAGLAAAQRAACPRCHLAAPRSGAPSRQTLTHALHAQPSKRHTRQHQQPAESSLPAGKHPTSPLTPMSLTFFCVPPPRRHAPSPPRLLTPAEGTAAARRPLWPPRSLPPPFLSPTPLTYPPSLHPLSPLIHQAAAPPRKKPHKNASPSAVQIASCLVFSPSPHPLQHPTLPPLSPPSRAARLHAPPRRGGAVRCACPPRPLPLPAAPFDRPTAR